MKERKKVGKPLHSISRLGSSERLLDLNSHKLLKSSSFPPIFFLPSSSRSHGSVIVDGSFSQSSEADPHETPAMGALTDNRKRCLVDLFYPLSSSSSINPPDSSQLKRQKIGFAPKSAEFRQPPLSSASRRFPAPCPLRRPVHGPQRTVRAFGGISSVGLAIWVPPKMTDRRGDDVKETPSMAHEVGVGSDGESLKLEEYKRLVETAQRNSSAAISQASPFASSEVTQIAVEEDALTYEHRLDLAIDETEVLEKNVVGRTTPVYKDLLLRAKNRDAKLSSLEFEVKLAEKRISVFSIVSREKPEEDLLGPFSPLLDDEEEEVCLALRECEKFHLPKHEVLVIHEGSNIEITRDILQCLRHGAWLNDEVINLYFELLKEREKREPKKFVKSHFFNTFFYKKLTGGRGNYDFKSVRRWTTQRKLGYGLIECDKIFVPIHKEIHWCLAVIDVRNETLLYLDSLGGYDGHVLSVLERYLMDEVRDKSNMNIDVTTWKKTRVDDLPLQKNGWDCGMFMIKYVDFITRGLGLCFQQDNMTYFRKRTAKEILQLRAE
ncbi:cysteine proteinases superfamily protein isoform X1 [Wolffia australiana]